MAPISAPRGYLDQGRGTPKPIDSLVGLLVRQAFKLYALGRYTPETLRHQRIHSRIGRHSFFLNAGLFERRLKSAPQSFVDRAMKFLELGRTSDLGFDLEISEEKREIVLALTSNLVARGKSLELTLHSELQEVLETRIFQ